MRVQLQVQVQVQVLQVQMQMQVQVQVRVQVQVQLHVASAGGASLPLPYHFSIRSILQKYEYSSGARTRLPFVLPSAYTLIRKRLESHQDPSWSLHSSFVLPSA